MPEVKHFHYPLAVVNPIINRVRGVKDFSHVWPPSNQGSHIRKATQDLDVVQEIVAKPLSQERKVLAGVFENFLKVGYRRF